MNNRWFCEGWKPAKPIRASRGIAAALILLGLAVGVPTAAAGVPDWLRTAATTPLAKYPEETKAVLLFSEQVTSVKDSGEIRTLYRNAYKILRPEGRRYATAVVYFDDETRLTYLKGWCIPASGKEYEVKEKEAVETSEFGELYMDTRYKVMRIPASEPGSVVGYEYEQSRRPYLRQDSWWFQETVPVVDARFTLRLPKGWEFDARWVNFTAAKPQQNGESEWHWELQNVPAITEEPEMPSWRALAGRLAVTYFSRQGPAGKNVGMSWAAIGDWYARLAAARLEVTPEIRQKVAELTSAKGSGPDSGTATTSVATATSATELLPVEPPATAAGTTWEKVVALASFVQRDIRYVAIEIGIGGYQPHYAREVFANRYGDCKDKVTLLRAMLHEVGIDSYYVLVNTHRGVLTPDFPFALGFNHVILALPTPSDAPKAGVYATLDHERLGRVLFFDPTDPQTPLGYLPPELQASYGLVVTERGGELVKLPLLAPTVNKVFRSAKLILTPEGGLYGTVQELRWGSPAVDLRAQLRNVPEADRAKFMESFLGFSLAGFTLQGLKAVNLEQHSDFLSLEYSFSTGGYAKAAGDLLLVRPRVLGNKGGGALAAAFDEKAGKRKYPVEFPETTVQSDVFEIILPGGYQVDELPPEVNVDAGIVQYRSTTKVTGNVLSYVRLYQVNDVLVPAARLADLSKLYRQIAADERSSAVLKKQAGERVNQRE
jgi:uncharacterized protein DUF3857/transglutaminase superfamily protein